MAEEAKAENQETGEKAPAAVVEKPQAGTEITPTEKQTPVQTPVEKVEFFKARQEAKARKDALAKENEELRARLAQMESQNTAPTQPETPPDLLQDPDKWANGVIERAKREALAEIQAREQEKQKNDSAVSARDWLLSQSHVKEDAEFARLVADNIQEKYMGVASVDPRAAARLAYLDALEAKGISGIQDDGKSASGVRPSGSPVGGKRVFTRSEIQSYVYDAKPGSPEFDRRISEVEEARREGRIR